MLAARMPRLRSIPAWRTPFVWRNGKSLARSTIPRPIPSSSNRIIAEFTPEFFARVGDFGMQTERPVFLVGLPRSGTTLIEQILASHSQVFGAGELTLARDAFAATCDSGKNPGIQHSGLDREGIQRLAGRHLDELHAAECHGACA